MVKREKVKSCIAAAMTASLAMVPLLSVYTTGQAAGTDVSVSEPVAMDEIIKAQWSDNQPSASSGIPQPIKYLDFETDDSYVEQDETRGKVYHSIPGRELELSNPYGSEELRSELTEFSEFDNPDYDNGTWINYNGRYQPNWQKGLTMSYWIKVPSDENGEYTPSSALRWELPEQEYYQADDYAKYLACKYYDIEAGQLKEQYNSLYAELGLDYETERKKNESKVIYGSDYYFKYAEVEEGQTDADGAPVAKMYVGNEGYEGPVYDVRYFDAGRLADEEEPPHVSAYYAFNPVYQRGYLKMSDGTIEAQIEEYAGSFYENFSTLDMEKGSYIRRADVYGELQIDVDNSIFWVPDNAQGIQKNPNRTETYGRKMGMHIGDCFFMNSWREGSTKDMRGNGTYQSSKTQAVSPVTSIKDYNKEDGSYTGVKNGNCDIWHQVTVTLQNDWVEFYVDGVCANVNGTYSSRGETSLDRRKAFRRLNKGTGLRYGWGSEKDALGFHYGNYVCRLLMDWMTDEEAMLYIGGKGEYAAEYAQATGEGEFYIDDLMFFDKLLTQEQIVSLYTTQSGATEPVTSSAPQASSAPQTSVEPEPTPSRMEETIQNEDGSVTNKVTETQTKEDGSYVETVTEKTTGGNGDVSDKVTETVTKPDGTTVTTIKETITKTDGTTEKVDKVTSQDETGRLMSLLNKLIKMAEDLYNRLSVLEKELADGLRFTKTRMETGSLGETGQVVSGCSVVDEVKDVSGISKERYEYDGAALPEDVEWNTTHMDSPDEADKGAMESERVTEYDVYDISPVSDGKVTDVSEGSVKVTLHCGNRWAGKKVRVYDFKNNKWLDAVAEGEYVSFHAEHFSKYAIAEAATVILGDIDGDNEITLKDAQLALKAALKLAPLEGDKADAADVDGDKAVTLQDAQKILKRALKLITTF